MLSTLTRRGTRVRGTTLRSEWETRLTIRNNGKRREETKRAAAAAVAAGGGSWAGQRAGAAPPPTIRVRTMPGRDKTCCRMKGSYISWLTFSSRWSLDSGRRAGKNRTGIQTSLRHLAPLLNALLDTLCLVCTLLSTFYSLTVLSVCGSTRMFHFVR